MLVLVLAGWAPDGGGVSKAADDDDDDDAIPVGHECVSGWAREQEEQEHNTNKDLLRGSTASARPRHASLADTEETAEFESSSGAAAGA